MNQFHTSILTVRGYNGRNPDLIVKPKHSIQFFFEFALFMRSGRVVKPLMKWKGASDSNEPESGLNLFFIKITFECFQPILSSFDLKTCLKKFFLKKILKFINIRLLKSQSQNTFSNFNIDFKSTPQFLVPLPQSFSFLRIRVNFNKFVYKKVIF